MDDKPMKDLHLDKASHTSKPHFFQNSETFTYISKQVLPQLLAQLDEQDRVLRIWIAGCGTGEESYTLAMFLIAMPGIEISQWNIKIFATDTDTDALAYARQGIYPESLLKEIPEQYHNVFLERSEQGYCLARTVRQRVVFGEHDLYSKAPFPDIDLIICQNILHKHLPELHDHIFNRLAFSLHPGGLLFLGREKTIYPSLTYYEPIDAQWQLNRCVGHPLIAKYSYKGKRKGKQAKESLLEYAATVEEFEITIEELKMSREELRTTNEELDLQNEELHKAREDLKLRIQEQIQVRQQLERLNQLREDFLSIASHEIRTPLTSINIHIQLLLYRLERNTQEETTDTTESVLTDELIKQSLQHTMRQVWRIDRLVNDLLDAARIQQEMLQIRREQCNIVAIVREAVEEYRLFASPRTISLQLPAQETIFILADADRIEQVISNYLSNACKYSPQEKPVAVTLSIEGEMVRLSVRDAGPGLPLDEQARIWERFYRVQNTAFQNDTGVDLGLGLHICSMIIQKHNGQVGVTSAPGQGATFWFTLPILAS
jgi:signal transduction histidine kinase/chemotaxis methyl-accepting protein methylase